MGYEQILQKNEAYCFEKNTLITLANGELEKISNIKPGTFILSYDHLGDSISQAFAWLCLPAITPGGNGVRGWEI